MKIQKKLSQANKKFVQPLFDMILGKTMSKKLMVFFLATIFIYHDILTGDQWVTVAAWYFGAQGTVDVVEAVTGKYKHKKSEDNLDN